MATGYDYVEPLPYNLTCPICLDALRDAHVTGCCGHQFCRECINAVHSKGKPCPLCKEPIFTIFLHKGIGREVNALKVFCSKKAEGCDWQGECGQLNNHLNLRESSEFGQREGGCGFVMVECPLNCGGTLKRCHLQDHLDNTCPHRGYDYKISRLETKLDVFEKESSAKIEALTAENTALTEEVRELKIEKKKNHEKLVKLEAALSAKNKEFESDIKALKQGLKNERIATQQSLERALAAGRTGGGKNTEVVDSLYAQSIALGEQVNDIKRKQTSARKQLDELSKIFPTPPVRVAIFNYMRHARENDVVLSNPFYSHQGGYKMMVLVYTNGLGKVRGTHISLFVHIMPGEYDHTLKWPFRGRVTVQMMSKSFTWDYEKTMIFDEKTKYNVTKRPVNGLANELWGYAEWMSKRDAHRDFFVGDAAMAFEVKQVLID